MYVFDERLTRRLVTDGNAVAKRKSLFDDRPVEISELTYVIKQDLATLNSQIAALQALTLSQHPKHNRAKTDQEGEHNDNVRVLLHVASRVPLIPAGCCYVTRQTRRSRRQFQRSPRGPNEEHSGLAFADREFCFVRFVQVANATRPPALRFSSLYGIWTAVPAAWLPQQQPVGSSVTRTVVVLGPGPATVWSRVERSAAADDGRGSTK